MKSSINTSNRVILFSGGIDSLYTALLLPNARLLYCKAGFSHQKKDLNSITNFERITKRKVIIENSLNLKSFETKNFETIFCRNLLFATIAGNYGNNIYLGGIRGDNALDKSPQAFKSMSFLLTQIGGKNFSIKSLLWQFTKTEIVKEILNFKDGKDLLLNSVSCYSSSSRHCGKCGSCFRRWVAMTNNNIQEGYEFPPWQWEEVPNYIQRMKQGLYDTKRTKETFKALRQYGISI
ncbi:MAG: hypothetical protein GYA14_01015 [Ignavibacteria bacterium]|nr:hypothetical protein [Ignavibacteria bacterium]